MLERYKYVGNAIERNLSFLNGRTVSFDLDGVTQATYLNVLSLVSHEFKKPYNHEHLTTYWELVNIARANGIPEDQCLDYMKSTWNQYDVYRNSPEIAGISTLLKILKDIQVPVVFISSRPMEFLEVTKEWFADKFAWIDPENIHIKRPDIVTGEAYKPAMVEAYNVGLHIEDAPDEANAVASQTTAKVLLVPQQWNRLATIESPNVKILEQGKASGVWSVIRFLASSDANAFLTNVAHY